MNDRERTIVKACIGYDRDYLFVSYAHVDKAKVEAILNILYRRGFRIWYDQGGGGIPGGEEWYPTIIKRIERSSSFLAFISNATEHRPIVIDEITRALKKKRENPSYKVLFVFLERISSEGFPDAIREEMKNSQFIDFKKRGGITEDFIELLCDVKWPETVVNQEYRKQHGLKPWSSDASEDIDMNDSISWFDEGSFLTINSGQLLTTETESGSIGFYTVSPDQIDTNTVYPTVMDNQWIPEELYDSDVFYREGVRGIDIAPMIIVRQRQEILRSLVHNRQIIVNRASILNSKVFSDWYDPNNPEYKDFISLLSKAALLLYLYKEHSPVDFPKAFHVPEENKRSWMSVCRDVPVYCLRLDWESEESNSYETDLIAYAFKNHCLSLADNQYLLENLERVFRIPACDIAESNRDHAGFLSIWREVQKDVFDYRDEAIKEGKKGVYNRERFYKSFLINSEKTTVDDGILDRGKNPFVKELKRIIDFYYSVNLPFSLGVRPLPPSDSPLPLNIFMRENSVTHLREIEVDELVFSVSEFQSSFMVESVRLPQSQFFSLGDITKLRELREWREYMRTISEGKKRASLDQLDFYDTKKVWDRHTGFIAAAEKLFPDKDWADRPAAISIIYYFEGIELITVYTCDRIRYRIKTSERDAKAALNRKSRLCVDYTCCDALTVDRNNLLVTELRLFEGITHTIGSIAYGKLIERFRKLGFIEDRGQT